MPINVLNGFLKTRQFDEDNSFAGNSILISRVDLQDCTRGARTFSLYMCRYSGSEVPNFMEQQPALTIIA